MNRKFTCIVCPNGCEIEVDYEGKAEKGRHIYRRFESSHRKVT